MSDPVRNPAPGPSWNPSLYEKFKDQRTRPALDLLSQVPLDEASDVIDLGCGPGHQTALLAKRYPDACVTGVDSSSDMLGQARETYGETDRLQWRLAQAETFNPDKPVDLVYSNAALHWVSDHETLFPRLVTWLNPDGVLAVQMPNNFEGPSHQLMRVVAEEGAWACRFEGFSGTSPVHSMDFYYEVLAGDVSDVTLWETTYAHVLEGPNPVAQWTRSTGLRPYLAALATEKEREAFFQGYASRIREAYPPGADGKTLFPFKRLFLVAVR